MMEMILFWILFISTIIIIVMVAGKEMQSGNKKLLDNINKFESEKKEYEPMNNGSKYYK